MVLEPGHAGLGLALEWVWSLVPWESAFSGVGQKPGSAGASLVVGSKGVGLEPEKCGVGKVRNLGS
jgi:hypothetical protein